MTNAPPGDCWGRRGCQGRSCDLVPSSNSCHPITKTIVMILVPDHHPDRDIDQDDQRWWWWSGVDDDDDDGDDDGDYDDLVWMMGTMMVVLVMVMIRCGSWWWWWWWWWWWSGVDDGAEDCADKRTDGCSVSWAPYLEHQPRPMCVGMMIVITMLLIMIIMNKWTAIWNSSPCPCVCRWWCCC